MNSYRHIGWQIVRGILLIALSGSMSVYAEGTVYKCKDPQGKLIYQAAPCAHSDVSVSNWSSQESGAVHSSNSAKFQRVLIIKQHDSGHYFVDGAINGKALTFIVDTGASVVSLPPNLAFQAGISCQQQVLMRTANGAINGCAGKLAQLKIGNFVLKDVTVMIAPNLDQPLLGMNVLQQFRIEQDNGEMRLTPKN
jgi:clan AA aspartic protease (TIGR02281 family)